MPLKWVFHAYMHTSSFAVTALLAHDCMTLELPDPSVAKKPRLVP